MSNLSESIKLHPELVVCGGGLWNSIRIHQSRSESINIHRNQITSNKVCDTSPSKSTRNRGNPWRFWETVVRWSSFHRLERLWVLAQPSILASPGLVTPRKHRLGVVLGKILRFFQATSRLYWAASGFYWAASGLYWKASGLYPAAPGLDVWWIRFHLKRITTINRLWLRRPRR